MNRIVPKLFDQALDANEVAKIDPAVAEKLEKFWMDHCCEFFLFILN